MLPRCTGVARVVARTDAVLPFAVTNASATSIAAGARSRIGPVYPWSRAAEQPTLVADASDDGLGTERPAEPRRTPSERRKADRTLAADVRGAGHDGGGDRRRGGDRRGDDRRLPPEGGPGARPRRSDPAVAR